MLLLDFLPRLALDTCFADDPARRGYRYLPCPTRTYAHAVCTVLVIVRAFLLAIDVLHVCVANDACSLPSAGLPRTLRLAQVGGGKGARGEDKPRALVCGCMGPTGIFSKVADGEHLTSLTTACAIHEWLMVMSRNRLVLRKYVYNCRTGDEF